MKVSLQSARARPGADLGPPGCSQGTHGVLGGAPEALEGYSSFPQSAACIPQAPSALATWVSFALCRHCHWLDRVVTAPPPHLSYRVCLSHCAPFISLFELAGHGISLRENTESVFQLS